MICQARIDFDKEEFDQINIGCYPTIHPGKRKKTTESDHRQSIHLKFRLD